jgi:hypothetical protein
MAFASPSASSRKILSVVDTGTSGTINYPFTIPQDSDTIVCKFWTGAQFPGALAGSATVFVQTTEDGGTTFRDLGAWAVTSVISNTNAHFQAFGAIASENNREALAWIGSVASGSTAPTSVASAAVGIPTGMTLMGTSGRVQVVYAGTVASNLGINVDIFAPTTQLR